MNPFHCTTGMLLLGIFLQEASKELRAHHILCCMQDQESCREFILEKTLDSCSWKWAQDSSSSLLSTVRSLSVAFLVNGFLASAWILPGQRTHNLLKHPAPLLSNLFSRESPWKGTGLEIRWTMALVPVLPLSSIMTLRETRKLN